MTQLARAASADPELAAQTSSIVLPAGECIGHHRNLLLKVCC